MKIAMVTDYGDITDESFNQFTYQSCKDYADDNSLDFQYYKPAGDTTADRDASIDQAVADGYNIVVMPGYAFAQAIVDSAPTYPDVKFIALDVAESDLSGADNADSADLSNVYCAVYQEELAGYMAGYAAAKMGYTNLGFLGGMAVPSVVRYGHGYVQGISDALEGTGTKATVNYAYGNQFNGDADITAAMDTWVNGGTQVIFACGGSIYTSAAEAAAKKDAKIIGVDVDQKATIDAKYGDGITITSAMKGLYATVQTVLKGIADGNWSDYSGKKAGTVQTLGIVSDDPEENYVQLPDSTVWTDDFSEDDYKALVKSLNAGDITVDNASDSAEPVTYNKDIVTVNYQGNLK
jgi:basic membrane protein A